MSPPFHCSLASTVSPTLPLQTVAPTEVEILHFSPGNKLLCVSSETGVVNIYQLSDAERMEGEPELGSPKLLSKCVLG